MNDQDAALLIELIASKICHDLTSPVGAVSNGVELLEEMGVDDDITNLISFSAEQATAKLKTLRMAYGLGGADTSIKLKTIHETFAAFIDGGGRIKQDWNPCMDLGFERARGFPKIMMGCLLFCADSLPKGGVVSVESLEDQAVLLKAEGENACVKEDYINAFERNISTNSLDPKLIHPYILSLFASKYGFEISIYSTGANFISLRLKQAVVS